MEKLFKCPALVVGIIALITVFLGIQLPRAELDNNNIRFLPDKNQAKLISEYIDDTFGGQVLILVGLERSYRTVFEKSFLERIRDFAQTVENIEYIKSVNSIMSTQYITGDNDSIVVSDLVPEDFSGTDAEITELKRRIASWDLFRGSLVSDDLSATQILITLNAVTADFTRPEVMRSIEKIRKIADDIFTDEAEVYFTGQPIVNAVINNSMIADNILLIPLVVIVVLAMLFFSFRRFTFVVLPFLTVIIAVVWAIGMAALFGIKLSVITTILPVILVAVGSAYGIHIVTHYMEDMRNKSLSIEEHRSLVLDLVKKLIKPVFLAALTTMAGFISFCFTPIVPMREFGYCASFGVFTAFAVAVLFIPSMFLLRGPRVLKERQKEQTDSGHFSNNIAGIFTGIAEKKIPVLVCAALAVVISLYGLSKVIVDNAVVEFFQNETDISRSDRFIREYFGGSKDLSLVIVAGTTEELLHPDVLQTVDNLSAYLTEYVPVVGKVVGFTDIIKRINQVFNVGESPEGLQSTISHNVMDSFGFNDTDDFGFSDFGFNDTPYIDTPRQENSFNITQYDTADILRFLDNAAGKSPHLNGSDLVKELKRLTNYEGMAYYEIPTNPQRYGKETHEELQRLIANYLVLLSGDDDSGYSNDPLEPTAIRTMIQMRTTGSRDSKAVIDTIKEYIAVNFPKNVRVIIGGSITYEMAVTDLIFNSQLISIFISVLIVFFIIAISNKSLIAGVIGAVPLTLAILCNFAVMGFLGIKLNLGTALISSLAVGIGIDYTIHFIEFFKHEYQSGKTDFLRRTFIGCGKAIMINALSVGAGFGVLAFSQFRIIAELGALIALSMLITAFVSLTVIPALLMMIKPKFIYGK
ncbi:MAG: MMPL family transporter [Treponema sp.]|jgi:predicted RND superfamily exporter protein|nr:MMPL family transporter [Treponema sp.]